MTYFVTGATGFIGRHLVERLLERDGQINVLVREGSRGRLEELIAGLGAAGAHRPGDRRPRRAAAGDLRRGRRAPARRRRALLPPGGDLRHDRRRRAQRAAQRRRHAPRGAAGQRAGGRPSAPRLLDRRRRPLQGALPRGLLRRGPAARAPLPPDEVRVREDRAHRVRGPLARLPPVHRRRPLRDRRDGQDRRALLLLQGDPEGPPPAARVGAAGGPRAGLHEHRPGRLRRRGAGPHRASARAPTARPSTSPRPSPSGWARS